MATLGPGVPVMIGWAPDSDCKGRGSNARLKRGVIDEGPIPPFHRLPEQYIDNETGNRRLRNGTRENIWIVRPDDTGEPYGVIESLLTPINDGGDVIEHERADECVS